jgi:hypothetical protein
VTTVDTADKETDMALHHLTCPSCGAGFNSAGAVRGHSDAEHRDKSPRERDILTCPECKVEFESRPERHVADTDKLKKSTE